ncbi:signal transduction histidine kinase [Hungatella effluvii]|uniref:histidine kinase n=2 Tax=Hungatella effluvii TaxID=1096246 RepID=A0A2V3YBQ4_9FIRM|nr:signal transduction histidine kinase [Hungatella effluvii]
MASVAIAMAAAFLLYMGIHTTAYDWIDRTQSTQEAYARQKVRTEEALQQYIKDNSIALSDLSPLDEWVEREAYVTMVIYRSGRVIYSSYPFDVENVIIPEEDAAETEVMPVSDDGAYTFTFADGTASVLLMPFYEYRYYQWADRISVICGFLLFITVFLHLIQKKTSYIELLKKELQILEGGQMEYAVSVKGSDELGELAEGINRMRMSILEREQKEAEARQANQELVTAMSHDLRSPLTSLLGYLELLDEEETEDAAQQKHFIAASRKKAMQIKEMSDRLFEYFLVYGREEKPAMEPVDGSALFQQTVGESAFALEGRGFTVNFQIEEMDGIYYVSVDLFRRVVDNLFSNLTKYAAREYPVTIACVQTKGGARLTIHNRKRMDGALVESSGIGLKTCGKIMKEHEGSFDTTEDDDGFTVTLFLPKA